MVQLTAVTGSSQVHSFGYDAAQRVLAIRFQNSAYVYYYQDVPQDIADDFAAAESKGQYVASHIKGKFEFTKVDTAAAENA